MTSKLQKSVKNWMLGQDKENYLQYGMVDSYNSTFLAEQASAHFEFELESDEDEMCFEVALEVIDVWEV